MQMSVRAGPIFIWSSSTEAPLKAKELWGQGFKAISFPRHTGHYLAPCVTLYLRKWGWLLGGSGYIYVGLYKCVLISRGEWVVTVRNFHQKHRHPFDVRVLHGHVATFGDVSGLPKNSQFQFIWTNTANISVVQRHTSCSVRC